MPKIKKIIRRYAYIIIVICMCFLVTFHVFGESEEFRNNKLKLNVIEEGIKSDDNQGLCKIPELPIDDPEIMKFYTQNSELDCGNRDGDWVICKKSRCYIKDWVVAAKGFVVCSFTDLVRKDDYKLKYGKTTRSSSYYILKESDFAKAVCRANNDERWYGIVIGIRETINRTLARTTAINHPKLNVLMYGFDSLSKNAFIRKLPKTYNLLKNKLKADVLQGYNIVGDGTPQALIPLLTGFNELELPETRKRVRSSNYVNVYPMIWKDYERNGYVTAFNEDTPKIGTFSYRLNGFDQQPTDHYMRPYYLEIESYISSYSPLCVGNIPSHQVMLDYTKNFMLKYTENPRFVFSFHGELSHDSINLIGVADNEIKHWLDELDESGVLNSTVLILMSDHGNRFAEVRNTLQGKQEERLPFFSFTFPEWFKRTYKSYYNNFLENLYRLTTPFDIHETLLDILYLQGIKKVRTDTKKTRAISLFQNIPKTRSCADAYIEPHWCACLNWKLVNHTTTEVIPHIVQAVINAINNYTQNNRHICERLELSEINWAMKLAPNDNLLKFKQNKDMDGYLADLTSQTRISTEIYQVKITLIPGQSIFEASVTHDVQTNKFLVNMSDISRINVYGNQAFCIYKKNPQLRKYCFCKTN